MGMSTLLPPKHQTPGRQVGQEGQSLDGAVTRPKDAESPHWGAHTPPWWTPAGSQGKTEEPKTETTMESPLFLISNDDGIDSPGIALLERVAGRFGDVITVAPHAQMSAASHSITLHAPLRLVDHGEGRFALEGGTPVDCVYVGLNHLCKRRPAWVLSGVNKGLNVSDDTYYSGTVAAAREAVLQGIPGAAFSMASGDGWDIHSIEDELATLVGEMIRHDFPERQLLNVNFPSPALGPLQDFQATTLGQRRFVDEIHVRTDPRGRDYLWIGGDDAWMGDVPGSDCNAIREGWVSVSVLRLDATVESDALNTWTILKRPDPRAAALP